MGAVACQNNILEIAFNPMYSACDGVHVFQVPAIVTGVSADAGLRGPASPASAASLTADEETGGTLITVLDAGTITITAAINGACGTATLNVDSATPDEWDAGFQRYNNGAIVSADAGARAAFQALLSVRRGRPGLHQLPWAPSHHVPLFRMWRTRRSRPPASAT